MDRCKSLKLLPELLPYLLDLNVHDCISLEKQESTNDIEANDRLKIGSLAKEWAVRYGRKYLGDTLPSLICYFPENKISTNKFKYQSMNPSLSLVGVDF
ncbi:hypothetical protein Goshw_020893 [Gossypium schwendimanii]|uniref:Uncharacterized protein n=1 Tax=Gossypium schwendimanii TaxID=34291 RepID=A0A7J9N2F6_GOSSC|nr:hypothetical protein [Gossypium schwendimanii]